MTIRNVLTENVSSVVRRRCLCRTMILDSKWSGKNGLHDEWGVLIKKKVLKTKLPFFPGPWKKNNSVHYRHLFTIFKNRSQRFSIKHQYKALRTLRGNSKYSEVVIHTGFSENYNCKYDKEIQSVHFGASQIQITLHTGLVYHDNDVFCSVSDFNKHGPSAIWAHLKPILQQVHQKTPSIETVHFVSDDLTTQYCCKQNFYLFSTQLLENFQVWLMEFSRGGPWEGPRRWHWRSYQASCRRFCC